MSNKDPNPQVGDLTGLWALQHNNILSIDEHYYRQSNIMSRSTLELLMYTCCDMPADGSLYMTVQRSPYINNVIIELIFCVLFQNTTWYLYTST